MSLKYSAQQSVFAMEILLVRDLYPPTLDPWHITCLPIFLYSCLFMTAFINMYNLNCNILSLKLCELSSLPTWLKPNDLSNKNSLFIRSYPYYVQSKKPRAGGSAKIHRQATIWCHGYSLLFPIKYNKTCFSETAINRRKSDPAAQKFYLSLQFSGPGLGQLHGAVRMLHNRHISRHAHWPPCL